MIRRWTKPLLLTALTLALIAALWWLPAREAVADRAPPGRKPVVFWHIWGGRERQVVERIVAEFNASQQEHYVVAVAMPGNNLDLKFLTSIAGGDPPDLLNQDDPVTADLAARRLIVPVDELASPAEAQRLAEWLFPAARKLVTYEDRLWAVPNGLDVRALYYDADVLEEFGLTPPATLAELDALALKVAPPERPGLPRRFGFLPDPRRLWAWGIVFGGRFYDEPTEQVTLEDPRVVAALDWMQSYSRMYGADRVAAFRSGDQALTGSSFPLLEGRYAALMDGQWRVAEIEAAARDAAARGARPPRFGVVPLPPPPGGLHDAGWVNGNVFLVPRGGRNPQGAWAFMRFWIGFGGHEDAAARHTIEGGWIPVSPAVVAQPEFQRYLQGHTLFATFVELAGSRNQVPTPAIPRAAYFQAEVIRAAEDALYRGVEPREALRGAQRNVERALREAADAP